MRVIASFGKYSELKMLAYEDKYCLKLGALKWGPCTCSTFKAFNRCVNKTSCSKA